MSRIHLSQIPTNISNLNKLERLNLNSNNIKKIPKELFDIRKLTRLHLKNNPILYLEEISNLDSRKIVTYFRSIYNKKTKPLNEAKILVLGDERVGKTSIVNRIVNNNFEKNQETTEGIDIQSHTLSNNIKVNIWDFAGQEITHQTHQFFLSTRSLYLYVLDAQKEDNDSVIYDWLEVIKANAGNSPIIIVANKYELNRGYLFDINRYKKDFPNIVDVISVSASNNENINQLVESIEKNIETLENVKDVLPEDWFSIKNELEKLSTNETDYIEGGRFDEICEQFGVINELEQETLLTILHEIGTVVRYDNKTLQNIQIINPLWVTNAVYKIIRSEFLNEDSILRQQDFMKIFNEDIKYKQRHYHWMIDLLIQFELAFKLDDNSVIIPSKLPNNQPDFDFIYFQNGLNLRYKYEGRLKKSIISQFMVKMHDEIARDLDIPYWQRGVFLEYKSGKGVVISEEEKKIITVSLTSKDKQGRGFLSNIRREFKKINKNMDVEEEVPLIVDGNIVGYEDYESLVLAEKDGDIYHRFKYKVDGESKSAKLAISDLLYGYKVIHNNDEEDKKPIIITEGKTDWKHLKKALDRFQKQGIYTDLEIKFIEYEKIEMGDGEIDKMIQTYSKTQQSKRHIFMFDRDNNKYVKKYGKNEFNNHENDVYSFCIPKISSELDEICIEFYYKNNDIKTKNKEGKRIFLGNEFLPNGNSKCGKFITQKRHSKVLDILDSDKKVFRKDDNEWKNNIALSKNTFANNVINDIERFDNFDIENFKLIFDVIVKIVNK